MMRAGRLGHVLVALQIASIWVSPVAKGQTLAGEWQGSITCGGLDNAGSSSPLTITLSPAGGSSYALTASFLNATAAGRVDGSQVSWSGGNFFNTLTANGNVNKDRMSGEYSQSIGPTCIWQASKVNGSDFTTATIPTSAERPTDGTGVDCALREEMVATELRKASDAMAELDRLPADCELNRTNLARTMTGYGESIVNMSSSLAKCNMVKAANFSKQGEWFYTAASELITSCVR